MSFRLKHLKSPFVEKRFTIGELIDNIEKNGLPQAYGRYWKGKKTLEDGTIAIGAGCALGQGAINSGVHWRDFVGALDSAGPSISSKVIGFNDREQMKLPDLANKLREQFAHLLERTVVIPIKYEVIKEEENVERIS